MKEMFIGKLLDLANYLMTALLVGYFIDPGSGNNRHMSFTVTILSIASMYITAILLGVASELKRLYNNFRR